MDALWELTQTPDQHQRWDLRFSEIDYLPRADGEPQKFRYAIRLFPGLVITGAGVTAGDHLDPGDRTSALRFASAHPLSPIRSGSGYWRYVQTADGVRFLTRYGYRPGWGRAVDLVFRPLIGWATAWSFDRLRLWLETGKTPERSLWQALAEVCVRVLVTATATALAPPATAVLVAALAVLLPPLPGTPAARRCLRRPTSSTSRPREPRTAKAPLPELETR
ncbi:hypothetical protein F5972_01325 [Microbispora cellulosiformans]|uniref:SRPBCC family protein n=1 Tax=Microbispora cellulosiformans TaxID=2614688 RepID=A0A5J5K9J8_9ACTN|nr:hypothetical protein [Microbispora cellulosiformans]KAA9381507.1 hypothetical protein F5972_01325 [Microbispora cellulosiformans]